MSIEDRPLDAPEQWGTRRVRVRIRRTRPDGSKSFTSPRTVIEYTYELEVDGLYELSAEGERWIVMCFTAKDSGEIKTARLSDARIKAWVAALDAGKSGREARLASKGL